MSKRAEEAALEICPPVIVKDEDGSLDDLTYMARTWVQRGYEQAEKETIERAVKWLEENVWEFTGLDFQILTESFKNAMK